MATNFFDSVNALISHGEARFAFFVLVAVVLAWAVVALSGCSLPPMHFSLLDFSIGASQPSSAPTSNIPPPSGGQKAAPNHGRSRRRRVSSNCRVSAPAAGINPGGFERVGQ
jgi:hypothetical protein